MTTTDPRGYVLVYVGKRHHLADVRGYAYQHRLVAEQKLGRRLRKGEEVHHKKTSSDNAPGDIEVKTSRWHHKVEHRKPGSKRRLPEERNPVIKCKCGCGARFPKYDNSNRPRLYVAGHWRKGRLGQWKSLCHIR